MNLEKSYSIFVYIVSLYNDEDLLLTPLERSFIDENISKLRKLKIINVDDYYDSYRVLERARTNYQNNKEYLYQKPRRDAQSFISKKKVREYIFKKHGKKCLCCGSINNISLDHVRPIYLKGTNTLDNLQPLCRSCNSKKGTKIIDYRNGRR